MRWSRHILAVGAAALALAGSGALAQSAPPRAEDDKEIVVTGRKPVDLKDASQFARHASAPVDGQLAKFNTPVCPMALGFPPLLARQIEDRMGDVAAAAGARVARRGCKGNMLLMAADDGGEMVQTMRRLGSHLIIGLDARTLRKLVKGPGPVRSWTFTELQNEDGQGVVPSDSGTPTMQIYTASHANPPTQQAIGLSIVVIDWQAMIGKTGVQIADYAAMRTLAKTNPVQGGAVDTILELFGGGAATLPELSEADLAYLQSLYAMPGTRFDHFQMGRIARDVKKASVASH